ncbi:hypothetical protein M1P56_20040 [Streptomyces sp. HU2014]|uniref:DUF2505 family protein n=1 Tax=Streptomyces sp. HU2014 TaxID=2939414 RepID=UPI00200CC8D8|nr:DUF2505 family protein [Streptomyces sp. HU2014]UQI46474.1 hypothetical protein M1P56_20040 [Streptomyces sp. HU2014]
MGKFAITHELNGTESETWALLLDDAFMGETYVQALEYPEWTVVERNEGSEQTTRRVAMQPKRAFPGPVAKVLGSGYREFEESTFHISTRVWEWKRIPSTLADKLSQSGVVRLEPIGDTKSRLISEIKIEAKVFGIGGLMESTFERAYREEADKVAASLNERLAKGTA